MVVYTRIHLVIVSIHTPTQGVTTSIMYPAQASQFQSTHPRRVWLQQQSSVQNSISFNPHTHAGCDLFIISFISERSVSIHTPTQGVTRRFEWEVCGTGCFNPHTHAGCDHVWIHSCHCSDVSIHTPTQGVTHGVFSQYARYRFQSTHPRRVWHRSVSLLHLQKGFNPHTHAGCDKMANAGGFGERGFNPHTHAGCDSISNNIL